MRFQTSLPALLSVLALAGAALAPSAFAEETPDPTGPVDGSTPVGSTAPPSPLATVPAGRPLFLEGADGRRLMDGPWLFRFDPTDVGQSQRFFAQTSVAGWFGATAPNVWNVGGASKTSYEGAVGWYRKDFRLPADARATDAWTVRFEAVNFRAKVWFNGKLVGEHVGGYTPFEIDLRNVRRGAVNRLVIRADNRRAMPIGVVSQPIPPTGWWNYGGLQREVYLRRVDRVDVGDVFVDPQLSASRASAVVSATATVRNRSATSQLVTLTGLFGRQRLTFGSIAIPAGQSTTFAARTTVKRPKLWSPAKPNLYRVRLAATAMAPRERRATPAAGYTLNTGIRSLVVSRAGQLVLNGQTVRFRGVAIHEDTLARGSALSNEDRAKVAELVHDTGSTLVRSHYPLHPQFQELADREGILLWSEIPSTYQLPETDLGRSVFRRLALQELREDVLANRNHPSIAVWSVGNEMASNSGRNQSWYLRAGADLVKQLKPSALVGLAFAGHPETSCQPGYAPIDVLGMNDYFGWYTGYNGNIADRDLLDAYLDYLRACYPRQAIAVTEYGAEANRDGPADEKGTYDFQREFVEYHLVTFARKPWLSGSVYWALQEFRIRDGWGGGNPWGQPPIHQKGLVRLDYSKKPAYDLLRTSYRSTRQYVSRGR